MRKTVRDRGGYDWETHETTRHRNARQITSIPAPEFPATGTARISAVLAEARRQRDEALVRVAGDGAAGLRTGTPADNAIASTPVRERVPVFEA